MRRSIPVAPTLFLALFAGQAGIIAVSPVLAEVAADFDVSTATAGQLRSLSGLAAGLAAVVLGPLTARVGLRELLQLGLAALGLGSLLSAVAPSFGFLLATQVLVGAGLAIVLTGGLAAAAQWSSDSDRAAILSWTLIGQPAAWIVGMPVIGALGDVNWRWGWIALPLAASLFGLAAVSTRPVDPHREVGKGTWELLRTHRAVAAWGIGELLAFSAWAGTLVFAGALVVESYGTSPGTAGLVLGAAAVAYLPGNFLARRWVDEHSRELLLVLPLLAAGIVAAFGAWRPETWVSAVVLAVLASVAGARTIAGSARGLEVCAERRVFAMRIRAAATQFGYLIGAAAGGAALALGGYRALGFTFAALFTLAAFPHLVVGSERAAPAIR